MNHSKIQGFIHDERRYCSVNTLKKQKERTKSSEQSVMVNARLLRKKQHNPIDIDIKQQKTKDMRILNYQIGFQHPS